YTKLLVLLPITDLPPEYFLTTLRCESPYAQGLIIFVLKDLCKKHPSLLVEILNSLIDSDDDTDADVAIPTEINVNTDEDTNVDITTDEGVDEEEAEEEEEEEDEEEVFGEEDLKKAICWLFWQNPEILTAQSIEVISRLVENKDQEVRRLACEVLSQLITSKSCRSDVIKILGSKIHDTSWRVQKIAVTSLLSNIQKRQLQDLGFWDQFLKLFKSPEWRVRKNIIEIVPSILSLENQENDTFLGAIYTALSDNNWEVREQAAISLNQASILDKQKYKIILNKISNLANDGHEEVRKTSCHIISERFNAFKNKKEIFLKIVTLLEDPSWIVRLEALENLNRFVNHPYWDLNTKKIIKNLLKLLVDDNVSLRKKTWTFLEKIAIKLFESLESELYVISTVADLLEHPLSDVRLKACNFLRRFGKDRDFDPKIQTHFNSLLEVDDLSLLECVWKSMIEHRIIFKDLYQQLPRLIETLKSLNPKVSQFVCEAADQFGLINDNKFVREQIIQLLSNSSEREVKKTVLQILSPYQQEQCYLTPQIIRSVFDEGQWDVQENLIPFILHFLTYSDDESPEKSEFQNIILTLLSDPVTKYRTITTRSIVSIDNLVEELETDLSEENVTKIFDSTNDDTQFEYWIKLEERLDLFKKMAHSKIDEMRDRLTESLQAQIKSGKGKSSYQKTIFQEIGLDTPLQIIEQMRNQHNVVRIRLLSEIMNNSHFLFPQLEQFVITSLLTDSSLSIRRMSWHIFQTKQLSNKGLDSKTFSILLDLIDNPYDDIRTNIIMVLLSHFDTIDSEVPKILNKMISKLEDHSFLVRTQVWRLIENILNISTITQELLSKKILILLAHGNSNIKKEARNMIKNELNVFLRVIDFSSQSSRVIHEFATICYELKKFDKAIELFSENVALNPSEAISWVGMALSHMHLNESGEVNEAIQKALTIDPLNPKIFSFWSKCMLGRDKEESKKLEIKALLLKERQKLL
ncbi:MAG: hypothetical protein ACFFCQ_15850, partial [Promethearchaeota archaeon]